MYTGIIISYNAYKNIYYKNIYYKTVKYLKLKKSSNNEEDE